MICTYGFYRLHIDSGPFGQSRLATTNQPSSSKIKVINNVQLKDDGGGGGGSHIIQQNLENAIQGGRRPPTPSVF